MAWVGYGFVKTCQVSGANAAADGGWSIREFSEKSNNCLDNQDSCCTLCWAFLTPAEVRRYFMVPLLFSAEIISFLRPPPNYELYSMML